jgi:signal transduction histidine kinase
MKALDGISKRSRIALLIAGIIIMTFFLVQTCIVFGICEPSYFLAEFGYGCVIAFMPPFFMVVYEFLQKKEQVAKELDKKNIYLEHAAKIIRHDMHSGINTYLPRGIKSLERRLSTEDIDRLKIKSPMQLISDGLHHAQKVYAGVYEFTNLVKENASMSKAECSIKDILDDYLKLTAYKNQVILDDNLPTIDVNEALFCTAIDNLIRNGLRYNDSGTKHVKIYNEDKYICVEDNGRGLTQADFDKLSEPYTRKKNQKESGTGLGLNICVQILNEHGFTITSQKTEQGTKLKIRYKNND